MEDTPLFVILATPTPLYIPLYLAKEASLDPIFRRIEFRYGSAKSSVIRADFTNKTNEPEDQLVLDVLENPKVLAGVADPFRGYGNSDLFVMSGLIQHMFFWLINHRTHLDETERKNLHNIFEQIVVTPNYMTSYAIACHDLITTCGVSSVAEADKYLYSSVVPGYEEKFCDALQERYEDRCDFAYITPDVLKFIKKARAKVYTYDYAAESNYKNTLMTGVLVSRTKHAAHPERYRNLQNGINRAIEMIYRDPLKVAWYLRHYNDGSINFKDLEETHEVLKYLVKHNAFPQNGEITANQVRSAAEIALIQMARKTSSLPSSYLNDDTRLAAHFAITEKQETTGGRTIVAPERSREWVEEELSEIASSENRNSVSAIRRMTLGIVVSVLLLVLDIILLVGSGPDFYGTRIPKFFFALFFLAVLPIPVALDTTTFFTKRMSYLLGLVTTWLVLGYLAMLVLLTYLRVEEYAATLRSESHANELYASELVVGIMVAVSVFAFFVAVLFLFYFRRMTIETRSRKIYKRLRRERRDDIRVREQLERVHLQGLAWYQKSFPRLAKLRTRRAV